MGSYSDEFRADAVVALKAAGYPEIEGALTRTAEQFNISLTTLRRWFKKESNPPPDEIVNKKTRDLADMFRQEVYGIMDLLPDKRAEASYKDLTTSAAIFTDKIQLLTDQPTEHRKLSGGLNVPDMSDDELDTILHAGGHPRSKNGKAATESTQ